MKRTRNSDTEIIKLETIHAVTAETRDMFAVEFRSALQACCRACCTCTNPQQMEVNVVGASRLEVFVDSFIADRSASHGALIRFPFVSVFCPSYFSLAFLFQLFWSRPFVSAIAELFLISDPSTRSKLFSLLLYPFQIVLILQSGP